MNIFQEAKQILDKDGKVNPLGPYGKQKLTGQEVAQYFRKNKVSDSKIKKAVEVALDLGGAMDIATKEIKKFYGDKILKSKEVQGALKFANEETVSEKFKPYIPKGSERVTDLYIQFRGDEKQSKKDFEQAKKIVSAYSKKHKLDIKDHPRNQVFGSPEQGSSAYKVSIYAKFTKDENHDLSPLYQQLSKLKTAEDHGGGYAKPITENYRTAARHGMGTEGKKEARVGLELDYYDREGVKHMGKIVKKDSKGYTVKDDKTGKMHTFVYHDRIKARKFLQKMGDNLGEGAFSVKLDKPYKRGDEKMYMDIIKKYGGKNLKYSPPKGRDLELDIFFDGGDVKKIKSNLPNKGEGSEWISEKATAQQAAIAIAKKEKAGKPGYDKEGKSLKKESVMNTYRQMWEDGQKYAPQLDEEVSNLTVDPRNKLPKPVDQNKHALEIVKNARRFGLKASMMGKHVRLKGAKKAVNDFLRTVVGRTSYGDPTEKDTSTPQIDKMLTKGLK